jgi:hypothetical protein
VCQTAIASLPNGKISPSFTPLKPKADLGMCLAGAGALLTSYAQPEAGEKVAAEKSAEAKLYSQNCASCRGASGEGRDACCMMMSGPNLLSAVLRMNAKAFHDEVRHVGETNLCAAHLLDLSCGR